MFNGKFEVEKDALVRCLALSEQCETGVAAAKTILNKLADKFFSADELIAFRCDRKYPEDFNFKKETFFKLIVREVNEYTQSYLQDSVEHNEGEQLFLKFRKFISEKEFPSVMSELNSSLGAKCSCIRS